MRYYDLKITKDFAVDETNPVKKTETLLHFSTFLEPQNGPNYQPLFNHYNPSYLEVEFDYITTSDSIKPQSNLKIFGVDLLTLHQAQQLVGATLSFKAGMGEGMPLSDPATAGQIFTSIISYASGTWNNQSDPNDPNAPANRTTCLEIYCHDEIMSETFPMLQFACKAKQSLAEAINNALKDYKINTDQIKLVECLEESHFHFQSLKEFIDRIIQMTKSWGMVYNYITACTKSDGSTIFFQHGEKLKDSIVKEIQFYEMIGQPSYEKTKDNEAKKFPYNLTFTTPLRADIQIGNLVQLPSDLAQGNLYGILKTIPGTGNEHTSDSAFSGIWQVQKIHHTGHSRDPNGQNWSSTFTVSFVQRAPLKE